MRITYVQPVQPEPYEPEVDPVASVFAASLLWLSVLIAGCFCIAYALAVITAIMLAPAWL